MKTEISKTDFGMSIPINPTKLELIGDGTYKFVEKVLVQSVENLDKAIYSEITKIAEEKGVTKLIVLDKDTIYKALDKATPKKAKRLEGYRTIQVCPVCERELIYSSHYCYDCGQKIAWEVEE